MTCSCYFPARPFAAPALATWHHFAPCVSVPWRSVPGWRDMSLFLGHFAPSLPLNLQFAPTEGLFAPGIGDATLAGVLCHRLLRLSLPAPGTAGLARTLRLARLGPLPSSLFGPGDTLLCRIPVHRAKPRHRVAGPALNTPGTLSTGCHASEVATARAATPTDI